MPPNGAISKLQAQFGLPKCYVMVRKLSLEHITRICVNPYSVVHRCGRCKNKLQQGPKCSRCKRFYHPDCAQMEGECCGKAILPLDSSLVASKCSKCKKGVQFGAQCTVCAAMFHNQCLSAFERCCKKTISVRSTKCGVCKEIIEVGPKCPFCGITYHYECIDSEFRCCNVRVVISENNCYNCQRCKRKLRDGSPLCLFCYKPSHVGCAKRYKLCCGRQIDTDIYFIPSFKHYLSINISMLCSPVRKHGKRKRWKSMPVLQKEAPVEYKRPRLTPAPPPLLEPGSTSTAEQSKETKRYSGKSQAPTKREVSRPRRSQNIPPVLEPATASTSKCAQEPSKRLSLPILSEQRSIPTEEDTNFADRIRIISVKSEEDDLDEPPVLDPPETTYDTPATSSEAMRRLFTPSFVFSNGSDRSEEPDPLESLFYFLYNSVKKLPAEIQNRVKFDVFKTVTDAEMQTLQHK